MSTREKRLLIFFGIAGFLVLNFLAFNFYQTKRQVAVAQLADAQRQLDQAEIIKESRDQVAEEMEWLRENEPEPAAAQDVQTQLQKFCESQASEAGLTIKIQRPMPTDSTEGRQYHRAKFQFTLTGTEESLYRWLDRVNVPADFRIATQIRLNPNKEDDTQIDCVTVVEQWFVPLSPSA
jgi:type II secretory pathway component PulM